MPSRYAVLLTPSISLRPLLPYFRKRLFLTSVLATLARPPEVLTLNIPTFNFSTFQRCLAYPLSFQTLAHSLALFCTHQEFNPFLFNRFPTLRQKTQPREWGYLSTFNSQLSTLTGRLFTYNSRLASRGGVMTFSQRFNEVRTGFERPFWVANITEIFERLSYYGAFASL